MRLIDADALEAILNNWEEKEADRTENDGSDGTTRIVHPVETDTDEMINLISMQPTITLTIPHSQWIPVTDRLPEETSEQYLVTVLELRWPNSDYDLIDSPTERPFVIAMYFDYTNKLWNASDGFVINALIDPEDILDGYVAVAWMPLPEPYQYAEVGTNEAD